MGTHTRVENRVLTDQQKDQFVRDGFLKLENAFPEEMAAEARRILWRETGCDPEDRSTWTRPVVRVGDCPQEPFQKAANTVVLHTAFDELVGAGRWVPRESLGGFPIRFPHPDTRATRGGMLTPVFPRPNERIRTSIGESM